MELPVRGERLWAGEGLEIWSTDRADRLILAFDDPEVCEAAYRIQGLLRRHALHSTFLERLDSRTFLIRRVEPLPVQAVVAAGPGETQVTLAGSDGRPLALEAALAAAQVAPKVLEMMEDVAAHAARCLRAALSLRGVERLRLVIRFGLAEDGSCLPQVINPLLCDLGTTEMLHLAHLLEGGKP